MNDPAYVEVKTPASKRLLLVEDNFLFGMMLVTQVRELGFEPVGPIASLREGLELARRDSWAGAILDINIKGGSSELIARELMHRDIPFFFITGYASPLLISDQLKSHFRLAKPVTTAVLRHAVTQRFAQGAQ